MNNVKNILENKIVDLLSISFKYTITKANFRNHPTRYIESIK